MKNDGLAKNNSLNYMSLIKAAILLVVSTVAFVLVFAVVMYLIEGGYEYSSLFATVSAAAGTLIGALYLGNAIGSKGILIGLGTGGAVFVILTVISLILDNGAVGLNVLFRFIILMLSALIGAIIGVNRKANKKYI